MEENLVSDFSNYGKDFIGFLDWFASKHGLDGASLEGTKDRDRFTFILWMGLNCHLISKIEISHPQTKGWDYLIYG